MTNYAKVERGRSAALSHEFGRNFAVRHFGQALVDRLPLYSRGPRKGLTKGYIIWDRVARGGWVKHGPGYMNGSVAGRGAYNVRLCWDKYGEDKAFLEAARFEDESLEQYAERVIKNLPDIAWREKP